jgi:pimeloyl-ACP methyl ester carboxylesterase
MPNAQLVVIPNAHHATPVERPEEFNTVLMNFLLDSCEKVRFQT